MQAQTGPGSAGWERGRGEKWVMQRVLKWVGGWEGLEQRGPGSARGDGRGVDVGSGQSRVGRQFDCTKPQMHPQQRPHLDVVELPLAGRALAVGPLPPLARRRLLPPPAWGRLLPPPTALLPAPARLLAGAAASPVRRLHRRAVPLLPAAAAAAAAGRSGALPAAPHVVARGGAAAVAACAGRAPVKSVRRLAGGPRVQAKVCEGIVCLPAATTHVPAAARAPGGEPVWHGRAAGAERRVSWRVELSACKVVARHGCCLCK